MESTDCHHLIIGNSTAAVGAVEAIRALDPASSVAIVAPEFEHTYSRPLITYFMCGKLPEEKVYYRPMDFYDRNRVRPILGASASEVRPADSTVILEDGRVLRYRNLLLAAGGAPIDPGLPGMNRPGVFFMNTMDDARRAKGWLAHCRRAVVIGAGLTGLKTAEDLTQMGQEVTVVEIADRPLGVNLDRAACDMVRKVFCENGVDVLTEVRVAAIEGGSDFNDVSAVDLSTGERIACDTVFVTIGITPRIELVRGSGIAANKGVLVDRHMRTNVANVYAAGDIAEAWDPLAGSQRVIPILPNAYIGGRVAGLNMAGRQADYNVGMSVNSVSFFGQPFMSAGYGNQEENDEFRVISRSDERGYRKFVIRDGRLVGMILTNDIDRAGVLTGMMRDQISIEGMEEALLEGGVGLMSLPADVRERRIHGDGRNWM